MKKKITLLVLLVLLLSVLLLPTSAAAAADTLTVQTRSGEHTFHVGDTFTYNYWLDISPDVLARFDYFDQDTLLLLRSAVLDSVSGNIMFDTTHLEVVEGSMPNFHLGIVTKKSDVLGGTLLDGTVLDFSDGDIFFKPLFINDDEAVLFREKNILVSVRFKVTSGSPTPVYMRTKLKKLDITFGSKTINFINNKNSIAVVPFASFETINDSQPNTLLDPYVGDQAFDIRCCRIPGDTENFLRPGAGVAVTFNGVSDKAEHLTFTQYSTGDNVFWFYDVPYGEYFVSCSYTSENGTKYETPKLSQGEYVSIPSTGIVQALWLFESTPQTVTLPNCPVSDGVAYADGVPVPFSNNAVTLDGINYKTLVVCTYNGNDPDPHKNYPTHMYVWTLSYLNGEYIAVRHSALDDILQYAGSSIRITDKNGIRMITGIPQTTKAGLIAGHIDYFTLKECGTLILWESDLGSAGLTLDSPNLKKGKAYQQNIADPVFRKVNGTAQYTNVLVGFSKDQCIPNLLMRPYMILEDALGESITLYGGIVTRSIGYIAYQNRTVFSPGSSSYDFIWDIIHYVYGNKYDADYAG